MAGRLDGVVAIITGASRGLGEYCAVGYAREGAKVAIAARTEVEKDERLPGTIYSTAKLVEQAGGEAFPVVCNVADYESVESMTQQVLDRWGQIDVLMTNAAVQPPGFISSIQVKHWELEFKVNVHGPFYCIRAALPSMVERGSGSIINISSGAARGGSHYGATKRAIETPGLLFGRAPGQVGGGRRGSRALPPPDSYVEAAVLLAMQTPQSFTGRVHNDAEIIRLLADDRSRERFRELNPEAWGAAMDS